MANNPRLLPADQVLSFTAQVNIIRERQVMLPLHDFLIRLVRRF